MDIVSERMTYSMSRRAIFSFRVRWHGVLRFRKIAMRTAEITQIGRFKSVIQSAHDVNIFIVAYKRSNA